VTIRKITILAVFAALACISYASGASAEPVPTKYTWAEPSTGSKPVEYLVEMRFRPKDAQDFGLWGQMGETAERFFILSLEPDHFYQVRVRARDAAGILGPYSVPSEPWLVPDDAGGEVETSNLGPLPIGGDKPVGPEPVDK
jgi:hypothetical protein